MDTRQIRDYRRALRRFERITSRQLKNCCSGVTLAQCLVLLEVEENDRLTTGQLASRLRLDNSTLSRTIDGLVRSGRLDRRRDGEDRRVVWIRLTSSGRATCRSIHKENDASCRRVFEKIPPSRRAAVIRNFEVLVQAYLDSEVESESQPRCEPTRNTGSASGRSRSAALPK